MTTWYRRLWSAIALLALFSSAQPEAIAIPAGDATQTLNLLGSYKKVSIFFDYCVVRSVKTHAVSHAADMKQALDIMLAGTGLIYYSPLPGIVSIGSPGPRPKNTHTDQCASALGKQNSTAPLLLLSRDPARGGEECDCALRIGNEVIGPWCRTADDRLLYAPEICPG